MWRGISLANKCLLLFGAAVVLIIVAALSVPWLRMNSLVDEGQIDASRQLVLGQVSRGEARGEAGAEPLAGGRIEALTFEAARARAEDRFVAQAVAAFEGDAGLEEFFQAGWDWDGTSRRYWFARRVRRGGEAGAPVREGDTLVVLDRSSRAAATQIAINTAYMLSAGLIAGGVAVLVFYLITTKIILSPVRELKETAEQIRQGDTKVRSQISTGDEFEELSETFNQMVEAISASQEQLRAINVSLDLKLNELAERNVALYEAARLKGEFLANVSHELRTPLNSIIGFADLLIEIADKEAAAGDDSSRLSKRRRYLENIVSAGRALLEMITGLLDMAKAEAGKMELQVEPMSVRDACEALVALIRPLADRGGVELAVEVAPDVPTIETDPQKFQQIVFNLLSNAVKFTGTDPGPGARQGGGGVDEGSRVERGPDPSRAARVTLRAERLFARGVEGASAEERVRVSILDTGPGIAPEDQKLIFEKFKQLDAGHTRRHPGTGLGLAIAKELTQMLQGEIMVESEVGRGSMFSVLLPLKIDAQRAAEMRLEMAFRGQLAVRAS